MNRPKYKPIVAILQCSNLGGMEQAAYWTLEYLQARGKQFRILTPRPFGDGKTRLKKIDPEAKDFEYKGKFGWKTRKEFREAINKAVEGSSAVWVTGTDAASLSSIQHLDIPKILAHHFHHGTSLREKIKWKGFYNFLCRKVDYITYPTHFTMNEARNLCPWLEEKTYHVPYAFEMKFSSMEEHSLKKTETRKQLNLPSNAFIIGNAGWLVPRKRWDVFLETAKKVSTLIPEAIFMMCGGGPLESDFKSLARDYGIENKVIFTGWVKNPDDYYWAWDVCLFNSDYDALGRTPIEAACCGAIPVTSVQYGGLPEFIEDGIQGFITKSHNTDFLTDRIQHIHKNNEEVEIILGNIREKLRTSFSPKQATEFYEQY